jgi:hypothetical protein
MAALLSPFSTQARGVKIRAVRTDGFGYPGSAQRWSNPFEASAWAQPRPCAQTDVSPCNPRSPSTPRRWSRAKGSVSPSDLSSITSSAPGLTVCAMVVQ